MTFNNVLIDLNLLCLGSFRMRQACTESITVTFVTSCWLDRCSPTTASLLSDVLSCFPSFILLTSYVLMPSWFALCVLNFGRLTRLSHEQTWWIIAKAHNEVKFPLRHGSPVPAFTFLLVRAPAVACIQTVIRLDKKGKWSWDKTS